MNTSEHFKQHELECHCGCGRNEMDLEFLDLLEDLRAWVGKPLTLSSAFRCPVHNNAVSSSGTNGPHTTGHAVDILVYGSIATDVIKGGIYLGMTGFGVNQKGHRGSRFIHLDDLSYPDYDRPWVWSY